MKVKKKVSIWKKGFDEKALGVSLGKGFFNGVFGSIPGVLSDTVDMISALKAGKTEEEMAFSLIFSALINACRAEGIRHKQWFKNPDGKDTREFSFYFDLQNRLDRAMDDSEMEINASFFERPSELPFLIKAEKIFIQEFRKYIPINQAKHIAYEISRNFPSELASLRESNPDYKILEDRLSHRFVNSWERMLAYGNYRKIISSEYLKPVFDDESMRLSDIYIEPSFTIHKHCFDTKDKRLENENNYFQSEKEKARFLFPVLKNQRRFDGNLHQKVSEFINYRDSLDSGSKNARVLLLLGHPGQGKTSFCKRLIYDIAIGNEPLKKEVFFFKLRAIRKAQALISDPLQVLTDYLIPRAFGENEMDVSRLSKSLLILDGLDELFMKDGLTYDDIEELCKNLADEAMDYPNLQIIITSRTAYVDIEKLKRRHFLILHLGLLSNEQQIKYLRQYKTFYNCKLSEEKLKEIHKNNKLKNIRELVNQPIILQLVAKADYEIIADSSITSIYKELFDSLITKVLERTYSDSGKIKVFENLKKNHLERYLETIAITIYQSNGEFIRRSDLEELPDTIEFMNSLKIDNLGDSLKSLAISFYFQEVDIYDSYGQEGNENFAIEFIHKSIQEFLVASKIWNTFKEIGDKKPNGDFFYKNGDWQRILELVSLVLGPKAMTKEVLNYLVELIDLEINIDKQVLSERLMLFLPDLIKKDFLLRYDSNPNIDFKNSPVNLVRNTFFGYWTVMISANNKRNLISGQLKAKLPFFLKLPGLSPPIILAGQDLSYTNFTAVDLDFADLESSNLKAAELINCSLTSANLRKANLSMANLEQAFLRDADMSYADLRETNFTQSDIIESKFVSADLRKASFRGAILFHADFNDANLSNAVLCFADLSSASLEKTYLIGANFRQAQLVGTRFRNAVLRKADFTRTNSVKCDCTGSDFGGAILSYADFSEATLSYANLEEAILIKTDLHKADLFEADLRGADLSGANLSEANLHGANLLNTNLQDVDLSKAKTLYLAKLSDDTKANLIKRGFEYLFVNPMD